MKEYDWEKVEVRDKRYDEGAKAVFELVKSFIPIAVYDKLYEEFFKGETK